MSRGRRRGRGRERGRGRGKAEVRGKQHLTLSFTSPQHRPRSLPGGGANADITSPSVLRVSVSLFRRCGAKNSHRRLSFSFLPECVEGARSAAALEMS